MRVTVLFLFSYKYWSLGKKTFLGLCEGQGVRAEFEMIHLRKVPSNCKHLTGLLNVFKSQIGISPLPEPVMISARFSYTLKDWTSFVWTQEPPDLDFLQGEVGVAELGTLPFGATFDPVSEMVLHTSWHVVRETLVVDSESYSDFDPLQAPEWTVSVKMADKPACLLSEYLTEFVLLCTSNRSMQELLGDLIQGQVANLVCFDAITESPMPTISKVIGRVKESSNTDFKDGPIPGDLLMPILYFLFPDADNGNKSPYPQHLNSSIGKDGKSPQDVMTGMKSSPIDSLVWRLSVAMAHALHTLGGVRAAAYLWFEFCQELRFRWERAITIPGVPPGFPDPKTCLLNQKLQMLNCCVDRKNARENASHTTFVDAVTESDDEDEEFFDCSTDMEDSADKPNSSHKSSQNTQKIKRKPNYSLWNIPVGRKSRHGSMRLLNTEEYLYIPVTQEPPPKTEDQLEEDAQVLLQLGTDAQGTEMRARMMSASLLSDMESFKAANPGAILEDFIRWYSPRDWIEDNELDEFGQPKGHLSPRMQIPGNTWLEVWNAAKPVPAHRQKRLFDDTRDAEKVLHLLDSQRPCDIAKLLIPTLFHAAASQLFGRAAPIEVPGLEAAVKHIINKTEILSRVQIVDIKRYQELCNDIASAETLIAQVVSLEHKLCPGTAQTHEMRCFLSDLVTKPEALVPGGPRSNIANRIKAMFTEAYKVAQMISDNDPTSGPGKPWSPTGAHVEFPAPCEKEFILRATAPRPAPTSLTLPHRLSVRICKDEIKMAGCFCQDTTFQ
uniref:Rab3 GTPase-activating protein catalytic subunit n=1 Tax=Clastoptera arizonana TaxID=38151 RepID=A0A1B6DTG6_9HEMI